ncbi:TauD/TfdA family dioxygenase [Nostoc favosum]|uniref:TauD/TfdA family dioxygenase n=1 Tax=Nostoc favosum CHAB5714 TaxID=2780399 RepID=A0ABS8ICY0_9NOSO|nr:TauD/TfdA family dioxygenase [Nostoc favosum]MCC5601618.1 TauD/TfdA family dioxygenase [Nostoc favosum CHAB5714]
MLKIEPVGISTAKIVYSKNEQSILSLSTHEVLEIFKSCGLLLFQGFGVNSEQMQAFAEQFSSRFILDRHRPIIDRKKGLVTLVDPDMHYISPHCENANTPSFRPDVVWFCCDVPAEEGGETLFWDGVQIWNEMNEDLRQLFASNKIRYFQKFPADLWKRFLGTGATLADVKRMLEGLEVNYQIYKDQSVSLEYFCSAVVKTKYGNQDAFANSILTENTEENDEDAIVTFEDGSLIPVVVINQIEQLMDRFTGVIPWQSGDLLMIDNSRFLHGRNSFTDSRRRVFSLLSYLK